MQPVSSLPRREIRVKAADQSQFFRGLVVAVTGSLLPWTGLVWYIHHGLS